MKTVSVFFVFTVTLMFFLPLKAEAFECPKHFKQTRNAIRKAEKAIKRMARIHQIRRMMSRKEMADTRKLLTIAKKWLRQAIRGHKRAKTLSGHGLAIAKADAARDYAKTADLLHMKYMGMSKMKKKRK